MNVWAITSHVNNGEVRWGYRLVHSNGIGGMIRQTLLLNSGVGVDVQR